MSAGNDADALAYLEKVSELAGVAIAEFVVPSSVQMVGGNMRLHYLDWGTEGKPPILFLHGWGLNAYSWDIVCLALRDRHHCVALDQRGHGDSEWSPVLDYGQAAHARDLAAVLDHLGAPDAVLVGMSLGGLNAMYLAGVAPERVRALVVSDTGPNVPPGRGREVVAFAGATEELVSVDDYVEQAVRFNPRRDPDLLRVSLMRNLRRRPDGGFVWKWDPRPLGSETAREDFERRRKELWELAGRMEVPTLLVRGANSQMFLPEDAEELAAHMPNARWVEVENAGHSVHGDNAAGFVRELERFLSPE
jgi:pimeloyl-ACP methyl ester carboxylesterase